jgi:hypothetical protein
VTLAMVAVLWVVAPLPLLFDVTTTVTDFTRRELTPGGVPAPEEWRGSMTAEAAFATALAVGVPLTGLVLALRWRRVVAAGLFTCAVGLGI